MIGQLLNNLEQFSETTSWTTLVSINPIGSKQMDLSITPSYEASLARVSLAGPVIGHMLKQRLSTATIR